METSNLPEEILIDIFSRLPPKSIGKCRCLAKMWRTLLSTPHFIKSHLTLKPYQQNLILLTPSNGSGFVHFAPAVADGAVSRKLQLPEIFSEIAGSCDGLVLLIDYENRKFLVNPITLQQIKITDSPLALDEGESFSMYGLGYDRINDDYKVVALSYWDTDNEYNPDCIDTFVDVYSVKMGVWKRVDSSPYDHAVPHHSCGAFVNGAIHWLASDRGEAHLSVIAAFDLADEVFDEIPAPKDVDLENFEYSKLVVVGGCLCMVDAGRNSTDVWMMKEYGVGESWTKFSIEGDIEFNVVKPLCYVGDEEVVLLNEDDSLVIYNVKAKSSREMVIDGVEAMFMDGVVIDGVEAMFLDGGVFVESLVSPAASVDVNL